MQSFRIAGREVSGLLSDRFARVALAVVVLVPLLYGALYLWAFWDPYSRLDRIPVAVVNLDRPTTVDGEVLSAGRDLVEELDDRGTMKWSVVSAREAARGLESGAYYMTLTIPRDFSASLATADSDRPVEARLRLAQNESSNMLASQIGGRVFSELRAATSASVSRTYYDNIFIGFGDLRTSLADAADGATDLHDGLAAARSGATELAAGASQAHAGADVLSSGLSELTTGAEKIDGGAQDVARGSSKLAEGLATARTGSAALEGGTRALASGASELSTGSRRVSDGAQSLATSAGKLASGAAELDAGVQAAAPQLTAAAAGAGKVAAGAAGVASALDAYIAAHPEAGADATLAQALGAARQTKAGAADVAAGLESADAGFGDLAAGAHDLADGAERLEAGATALAAGAAGVSDGASKVSAASSQVAAGTSSLSHGVVGAATGASSLAVGSKALSGGTSRLVDGVGDAESGARRLAAGLVRLDGGTHDLASGLAPAVSGSRELASGLTAGLEDVPHFSARERAANAQMMSDPVTLDTTRVGAVETYGTGFSPYFIPLALWVGAVIIFFVVPPLSPEALSGRVPAPVAALASYWPAALLGVAQTVVMLLVIRFGLGLDPQSVPALFAFTALTSLVFIAILQWLSASFGLAGKFIAIVLLMLQLTSAAGTFPLETLPTFFRTISPLLPMTYVVAGLRQIISGGDLSAAWRDAVVLACYGLAAIALTFWSVRLRRAGKLTLATREI